MIYDFAALTHASDITECPFWHKLFSDFLSARTLDYDRLYRAFSARL